MDAEVDAEVIAEVDAEVDTDVNAEVDAKVDVGDAVVGVDVDVKAEFPSSLLLKQVVALKPVFSDASLNNLQAYFSHSILTIFSQVLFTSCMHSSGFI